MTFIKGKKAKEVFIVHSKGSRQEDQIATETVRVLGMAGYTVYEYADWSWEQKTARKSYSRVSGDRIDIERYVSGQPFLESQHAVRKVDFQTLAIMLKWCRLVIFIRPRSGRLSKGVGMEIRLLRKVASQREREGIPPLMTVCCSLPGIDAGPVLPHCDGQVEIPTFDRHIADSPEALSGLLYLYVLSSHLLLRQCINKIRKYESEKIDPFAGEYIDERALTRQLTLEDWWPNGIPQERSKAKGLAEYVHAIIQKESRLGSDINLVTHLNQLNTLILEGK